MRHRRTIELFLTPENVATELHKGDVIVGAEELGVVKSARPTARPADRAALVYFMGGDCYRELFGIPQTVHVLRYPDGPEFEWADSPLGTHVMVEISKTGGGTPGRRYTGLWSYRVTVKGQVREEGDDFRTGMPRTHAEAAREVYAMLDGSYDPMLGAERDEPEV